MASVGARQLAAWALAVNAIPATQLTAASVTKHRFDVPAGRLRDAVVAVGRQGTVTIGLTDPTLADLRIRALRRTTTVQDALARLLSGTPAMAIRIDEATFRIVRRPARSLATVPARAPQLKWTNDEEVVVRASKRDTRLANYPGSVQRLDVGSLSPEALARGSDALVERMPVLTSTHLGPGRDKLFIRGIADSSFTGRNQATVGEYLGDVRLNYNAPDPNLALYDLQSVEVLEGPQGTLYGAGALGGVLRLQPNVPDLTAPSGFAAAGGRIGAQGREGYDAVGVLNLPLVHDRLGLRVVGYAGLDGGYVDDLQRNKKDVNRTTQRGVRASLRYRPGPWTIDLGFVRQDVLSRDGQYAERGLPPLTRRSAIAQPFDNDYQLGSVAISRTFGPIRLTSTTALVRHDLATTYDATIIPGTILAYKQDDRFSVLSNETRLASTDGRVTDWVFGIELLRSHERTIRRYGSPSALASIPGTDSVIEEASLFGELTLRPHSRLALTLGGRAVLARRGDETLDEVDDGREPTRTDHSFLPTLALHWTPTAGLTTYLRYQEGFRSGGLVAAEGIVQRYRSDTVATVEGGLRYRPASHWSLSAALSYAHWEQIQADLVTAAGFPTVANIGSGHVTSGEAEAEWRPSKRLKLEAALFLNESNLSDPAQGFAGVQDAALPNIADVVARTGFQYDLPVADRVALLHGSVRYVGRSRLGVGSQLDFGQGGYFDTAAGLSFPLGQVTISLDATNVLNARSNIFAFGNPFQLFSGRQITPQPPRTIRIGIAHAF